MVGVRSVEWCIPVCVCVYIDTEGQTVCLQPPRLDQLAWIPTGVHGKCVNVCVRYILHSTWFCHTVITTQEYILKRITVTKCLFKVVCLYASVCDVCTMNYCCQWKTSRKWRNLSSHSCYNKTTHSDIFFSLAGVWTSVPGNHSNANYVYKTPGRC